MKKLIKKLGTLSLFYALSALQIPLAFADADAQEGNSLRVELNEPIGDVTVVEADTAIGFIVQYIRVMYNYGAATVGIVCVLVISISGMQYAMDSGSAEDAKKRIINSISGLALLFLSAIFLYFINPNFFTAG